MRRLAHGVVGTRLDSGDTGTSWHVGQWRDRQAHQRGRREASQFEYETKGHDPHRRRKFALPVPIKRQRRPSFGSRGPHGPRWRAPRQHMPLWYLLDARNNNGFKRRVLPTHSFFDSDHILTRHDLTTVDQRFKPYDFSPAPNTTHRYKYHDYSTARNPDTAGRCG